MIPFALRTSSVRPLRFKMPLAAETAAGRDTHPPRGGQKRAFDQTSPRATDVIAISHLRRDARTDRRFALRGAASPRQGRPFPVRSTDTLSRRAEYVAGFTQGISAQRPGAARLFGRRSPKMRPEIEEIPQD